MSQPERRKSPRIPADGGVTAEIVGVRQAITLVNVGTGGCSVATDEWLVSTPRPEIRFQTADRQWSATFEVRMSFTQLQPRKTGPFAGKYITGFAFRDAKSAKSRAAIRELIERAARVAA